jgi:hypothetical protein
MYVLYYVVEYVVIYVVIPAIPSVGVSAVVLVEASVKNPELRKFEKIANL